MCVRLAYYKFTYVQTSVHDKNYHIVNHYTLITYLQYTVEVTSTKNPTAHFTLHVAYYRTFC